MKPKRPSSLFEDSAAFSVATLMSRVFGYCRDATLAAVVPAEWTDLFLACFRIPNTFRRLFGEGAVSVAFIPTFSKTDKENPEKARQLFGATLQVVGLATGLVVLVGLLFSDSFLPFYLGLSEGPESAPVLAKAKLLLVWMFPYLILICLAAVAAGVLNTRGKFFVPAVTPVFFNLSIIVTTVCYGYFANPSLTWLGLGVFIGGCFQLLFLIPSLYRVRCLPVWVGNPFADPRLKDAVRLFLPATVTLGVTQINLLVNTKFALALGEGPNSYLFYANRLADLPLGVFGIAIAAASFPKFSEGALEENRSQLKSPLQNSLKGTLLVSLPSMVGIWILAEPLVDLLFNRGEFAAKGGLAGTVAPLRVYVLGLISFTGAKIFGNLCYAVGDPKSPVVASVCSVLTNLFLAYWLRFTWLEHSGIALAVVLGATVNMGVLVYRLRHVVSRTWLLEIVPAGLRIGCASLLMGFSVAGFLHVTPELPSILRVGGGMGIGAMTYFAIGSILFEDLLDPILRRVLPGRKSRRT